MTLGEAQIVVDGEPVDFSQTFSYKGFMYSGVPNLASSFGYINASWTLRADLICRYVCRLLNHMRDTGTTIVHTDAAPERRRDDGPPVDRGLLLRLHAARHGQAAQAG